MPKATVEYKGKKFSVEGTPEQIEAAAKQITGFQEEGTKSFTAQDALHVLAKGASGALMGVPEMAARNPLSGIPGAGMQVGGAIAGALNPLAKDYESGRVFKQEPNMFPEAETDTGKVLGILGELAGGFMSPSAEVAGKATNEAAEKAGSKLMNSAINAAPYELKDGRNLGSEALKGGFKGSVRGMLNKVESFIEANESKVSEALKGRPERVNILDIADELENSKKPFTDVGDQSSVKAISNVQDALLEKSLKHGNDGTIPVEEAQQLKINFNRVVGDKKFQLDNPTAALQARRQVSGKLAGKIESAVPDLPIREMNKKLSLNYRMQKALENRVAQMDKNGIGLMDFASAGGGPKWVALNIMRRLIGGSDGQAILGQGLHQAGNSGAAGVLPRLLASIAQTGGKVATQYQNSEGE